MKNSLYSGVSNSRPLGRDSLESPALTTRPRVCSTDNYYAIKKYYCTNKYYSHFIHRHYTQDKSTNIEMTLFTSTDVNKILIKEMYFIQCCFVQTSKQNLS